MLTEPINLGQINATEIIDHLYGIFHRDFVANRTYLAETIYMSGPV